MCRIRGWVLDGFPETKAQAQLLRQYSTNHLHTLIHQTSNAIHAHADSKV
jgi:adenylate kinase family enzyme